MKRNLYPVLLLAAVLPFTITGCAGDSAQKSAKPAVTTESAEETTTAKNSASITDQQTVRAVYLGVENYGAAETNKDNRDTFRYRFEVNGEEKVYPADNGNHYAIQNQLKEDYTFDITVSDNTVVAVQEIDNPAVGPYTSPVSGTAGEKTLTNFLKTAMEPVGTTLYIYGGGWDWQDEGSSIQTRTLGVSPDWVNFFQKQTADYTYKDESDPANSYYPFGAYNEYYYAGLDCSGYVGWTLYNTLETKNGKEGYVAGSTGLAKKLSEKGWGKWTQEVTPPGQNNNFTVRPGDVMSINGHVWISLGTCTDKSVLILHSTPSESRKGQPGGGVQLSAIGKNKKCEAYRLASKYMTDYFPEWSKRYETALKNPNDYFVFEGEDAGLFSWDTTAADGLRDPDGLQKMSPKEVLSVIWGSKKE